MREGDYLYHQRDKKYYPFVRSEEKRIHESEKDQSDDVLFIRKHADTLKRIIRKFEEQGLLLLNKRIYSKGQSLSVKASE